MANSSAEGKVDIKRTDSEKGFGGRTLDSQPSPDSLWRTTSRTTEPSATRFSSNRIRKNRSSFSGMISSDSFRPWGWEVPETIENARGRLECTVALTRMTRLSGLKTMSAFSREWASFTPNRRQPELSTFRSWNLGVTLSVASLKIEDPARIEAVIFPSLRGLIARRTFLALPGPSDIDSGPSSVTSAEVAERGFTVNTAVVMALLWNTKA
mmetsp:Transcript_8520/g.17269  ORF Transcript_8520/g.17269 Transcript_8520/m.17269 type:complete len:211 (+) Transcript_8520:1651-2283(+)